MSANKVFDHPFITNQVLEQESKESNTSSHHSTSRTENDISDNESDHMIEAEEWVIPQNLKTPAAYAPHSHYFTPILSTPSTDLHDIQSGLLSPSTFQKLEQRMSTTETSESNGYTGRAHENDGSRSISEHTIDALRGHLKGCRIAKANPIKLCIEQSNLFKRRKAHRN
jgi:hypothetical protein